MIAAPTILPLNVVRYASTGLPGSSSGDSKSENGTKRGSALRSLALILGTGAVAVYFFSGTIWNIVIGTTVLLVGRAITVRALHWPESKRPFIGRSMFLAARRIVHGSVRNGTLSAFLVMASASAAHNSISDGVDSIAAL